MKHEVITLSDADRQIAEVFADARSIKDSSLYSKRGAFKRDDVLVGALGELAVYRFLRAKGIRLKAPDFKIHAIRNKSYSSDLEFKGNFLHVKSQSLSSQERYGSSWLMQRKDPLFTKDNKKHFIVPNIVDLENNSVKIYGFFSVEEIIKKGLVGECSVPYFRDNKVAIYLDSLKEIVSANRWRLLNG